MYRVSLSKARFALHGSALLIMCWALQSGLHVATAQPPGAATELAEGEQMFKNNCMACHQHNGKGLPGVYPALAGSEVVRGSADDVVLVALVGRGDMPSFKGRFKPQEFASLVNYIRNSWGNFGAPISADRVARLEASVD